MRLFFALDLPPATARAVTLWRERNPIAAGRPVPAANLHLTLAFLGELEERQLEPLCEATDAQLASRTPGAARLALDCVGYWPRPGVFWLGSTQAPPPALQALARGLQQLGGRFGSRVPKHSWTPHITLYRGLELPPAAPLQPPALQLEQERLTLFRTVAGRQGVRYEALCEWPLAPRRAPGPGAG